MRDEDLLPSFLYLPGATDFPAGSIALPWDDAPNVRRRTPRPKARRRKCRPPGLLRQELALALRRRSHLSAAARFARPKASTRSRPSTPAAATWSTCARPGTPKCPTRPSRRSTCWSPCPRPSTPWRANSRSKPPSRPAIRTSPCSKSRRPPSTPGSSATPIGASASRVGDLILVVDIGGGTTDFTLIAVTEANGELSLNRVAVGDHILLGGDNIDLALAGVVAQRLAEKGTKIDSRQHQALWANCRVAKEKLLEPGAKAKEQPVTILGKGSGLIGGTIKATLLAERYRAACSARASCPTVASTEMPAMQRRVGLQELGLPYAADPAITRHMARFLRQQAASVEHGAVRRGPSGIAAPTHVLFNGGVLNADLVRERMLATLDSWLAAEGLPPVKPLSGEDLMHAVSRGAAYYGMARTGRGVRIRGGVPRTYYVGVESAMPSIPGFPAPLKALAVVPFGMEEGTETRIPGREFGLVVGQPAEFRFFTSASRKNDQPGDLIEDYGDALEELSPMEVSFECRRDLRGSAGRDSRAWSPRPACCNSGASPATAAAGSSSSTSARRCSAALRSLSSSGNVQDCARSK